MEAPRQDLLTSIGLLILRVGAAGYMVTHGWGKLQMLRAGGGFADPIGIGPQASLVLATFAEFACALLVLVGLGTRLAAVPVVFTMAVAAFLVHGNDPWTAGAGPRSKEPALLFLAAFLAIVFTGAGRFSFDALLWPRLRRRKAAPPDGV